MSKPWNPHMYQLNAMTLMVRQACAGLLLGVGLGKTSIVWGVIKTLISKGLMRSALIIAPLRPCYHTWPAEMRKWAEFEGLTYSILHGKDKDKALKAKADVYIINPEGLEWLWNQPAAWPFDVLVVDESTMFKNSQTKRFKLLKRFLPHFRRRYILTGTPCPQGLLDLFGQIYILDEGASLGKYITHYRTEYFIPDRNGWNWVPQKDALQRITEKIAPLCMRMASSDYLELPELVTNQIVITLPFEAREIYKQLEKEFLAVINQEVVLAANAAVAGGKCLQLCGGAVYTDGDDYEVVHDEKIEALRELIDELSGEPLLIFFAFTHEQERIEKELGISSLGHTTKKDAALIEAFNAGTLPALMAHPASAGHGLNLQGACAHVCFFGMTWNLEYYEQAIGRIWRQGNTSTRVIVHHLIVEDSIEENVVAVLSDKSKTQSGFLDLVKKMRNVSQEASNDPR